MKVLLFGENALQVLAEVSKKFDLKIVNENLFESEPKGSIPQSRRPDVVISFGGDGTLLSAERKYPGIPKLPIRNSQFCNKCADHADEHLLTQLLQNKLQIKEYKKIHTNISGKDLYAFNDFVIRNALPIHAIRFKINAGSLLLGDGIVVATPFGSNGYFKSITGKHFAEGFGLAFNNTTQKVEPTFLKDTDQLKFKLLRGNGVLSFDNSPDIKNIEKDSELIFNVSDKVAKIYENTSLHCPNCKVQR
jgi:NAD+ kinase